MSVEYTTSERLNRAVEELEAALYEARNDAEALSLTVGCGDALQKIYAERHALAHSKMIKEQY